MVLQPKHTLCVAVADTVYSDDSDHQGGSHRKIGSVHVLQPYSGISFIYVYLEQIIFQLFAWKPLTAHNIVCILHMPAEQHEADHIDYQGICWMSVTETRTCTLPLASSRKTTYTECCCLYGEAWGMDCALCPAKNTGTQYTYTQMLHRNIYVTAILLYNPFMYFLSNIIFSFSKNKCKSSLFCLLTCTQNCCG